MTDTTLDMLELARFAVLPGASRLVTAFAAIPPGPLRDSVIHHAEVIASTYTGAPAAMRMPDPLASLEPAGGRRKQALAISDTRTGRRPPGADSPQMQAVQMRVENVPVAEVCEKTGLTKQQVYQAVFEARKAGIKFPGRQYTGPVKPGTKVWYTRVEDLSHQGIAMVAKAAETRGITAQEYLDRRVLALELAQAGHGYETIIQRTGEKDSKVVSAWLSAARGAGHIVPYVTFVQEVHEEPEAAAEPEAEAPPEPEPEPVLEAVIAPVGRVFPPLETQSVGSAAMITRAAQKRNMTVSAYQDMRESIVRHRMDGKTNSAIAKLIGEQVYFVSDVIKAAIARGVQFPPSATNDEDAEPALKEAG